MNTLYALIVVSHLGSNEAYVFQNKKDCEQASQKINNSFCTIKEQVNIQAELEKFFVIFDKMREKMERNSD